MARLRSTDHHLPPRCYSKHGSIYYVDHAGHWHRLGSAWDRAAKEKYDEIARGIAAPRTVAALLNAFLLERERQVRAGQASKRTLEDNEQEAKVLRVVFGQLLVTDVTSSHVAQFLRKRTDKEGKPAPVRANREAALLSSAYAWGMGLPEWDINRNPCYGVRRNKERPRRRYVTTSELAAWKQHAPDWLRAYVLLKRLVGARQGDMLKFTRTNLTDRGLEYQEGKDRTKRPRIVRWSWALRVAVNAVKTLSEIPRTKRAEKVKPLVLPLFPSRFGTPLTAHGFKIAWARSMRLHAAAGNESFREHDIRAKTASDTDARHAQELMGHASQSTTNRVYRRGPAKVRPLR